MANILITGAKGQVGSALQQLSSNSIHSCTFVSKEQLDISDQKAISTFLDSNDFDLLINCAAYTQVDKAEDEQEVCYLINRDAVGYLSMASAKKDISFIHISSDYVYHPDHDYVMFEDQTTNPKGIYAKSKLEGDLLALENNPKTIILRTSWVYAKKGKNFVNTISRISAEREFITVIDDQIGSPTYAYDLAETILLIAGKLTTQVVQKDNYGTYHYSNEGLISWFDFASEIVIQKNHACIVKRCSTSDYPTAAPRPKNSRLSKSKIERIFGIKIKPWKESLQRCLSSQS